MEQKLPISVEIKLLDLYNKTKIDKPFNIKYLAKQLNYFDSNQNFILMKNKLIESGVLYNIEMEDEEDTKRFYKLDYKKLFDFIINNCVIFNKSLYCVLTKHPDIQLMVKFKNIEP